MGDGDGEARSLTEQMRFKSTTLNPIFCSLYKDGRFRRGHFRHLPRLCFLKSGHFKYAHDDSFL